MMDVAWLLVVFGCGDDVWSGWFENWLKYFSWLARDWFSLVIVVYLFIYLLFCALFHWWSFWLIGVIYFLLPRAGWIVYWIFVVVICYFLNYLSFAWLVGWTVAHLGALVNYRTLFFYGRLVVAEWMVVVEWWLLVVFIYFEDRRKWLVVIYLFIYSYHDLTCTSGILIDLFVISFFYLTVFGLAYHIVWWNTLFVYFQMCYIVLGWFFSHIFCTLTFFSAYFSLNIGLLYLQLLFSLLYLVFHCLLAFDTVLLEFSLLDLQNTFYWTLQKTTHLLAALLFFYKQIVCLWADFLVWIGFVFLVPTISWLVPKHYIFLIWSFFLLTGLFGYSAWCLPSNTYTRWGPRL